MPWAPASRSASMMSQKSFSLMTEWSELQPSRASGTTVGLLIPGRMLMILSMAWLGRIEHNILVIPGGLHRFNPEQEFIQGPLFFRRQIRVGYQNRFGPKNHLYFFQAIAQQGTARTNQVADGIRQPDAGRNFYRSADFGGCRLQCLALAERLPGCGDKRLRCFFPTNPALPGIPGRGARQ